MKGTLYGVGVGPGDPELMTLKSIRIIKEGDILALPGKIPEETVAYEIARGAVPDIEGKERIGIHMPMTKDPVLLVESHREGVEKIISILDEGRSVVFLTLGDPTIYSTYLYIHRRIEALGYPVEIVSGIPSFCAASARLNAGLVEGDEALHILPASYPVSQGLALKGTKVLMKAGKKMGEVKEQLKAYDVDVKMVENCGLPGEKIYLSVDEIPEDSSYFSLMIVKEK